MPSSKSGNRTNHKKRIKDITKNKIFTRILKSAGRRTILTEALIAEFVELIPKVMFLETAADLIGVHRVTWRHWLKLGREEIKRLESNEDAKLEPRRRLHVLFYYSYRAALAQAESNAITTVAKASKKYWAAGAWILERTRPTKYGSHAKEIKDLQKEVQALAKHLGKEQPA